jgi:predicted Zn-dependent protease
MDVVHEVGHIAGLQHTADGVMAAVTSLDDVPYYCRHVRAFRRTL